MANIKVAVRVRPISEREIHLTGSEIVVHTEPKVVSLTNLKVSSSKAGDSRERTRRYGFNYCFDSSEPGSENYASQTKIYESLGVSVLDALFKGYNSCLVAYGQSASGKTYTMMGSKEDPGLIPRVCKGLFLRLTNVENTDQNYDVSISYLEVYNERVRDLLRPTSSSIGLRVREHPRLGPYVQGLTHHPVPTIGSLISRVEEGTRARKTASTLQNPTSSRSHALLTLTLLPSASNLGQSAVASAGAPSGFTRRNDFPRGSKLHLVDLAGSESAAACGGINRLKEGANINKSLVALGNVISALAERGSTGTGPGRRFIPYRDSALTWLLKDALGGNATTVMLATISPASGSYNETSHTLRFAQRAQSVVNRPVINEDPVSRIIRELRAEVSRLKCLLQEKNCNPAVDCKSVCLCQCGQEPNVTEGPETEKVDDKGRNEEDERLVEVEHLRFSERRHSTSDGPVSRKELVSPVRRFASFETFNDSTCPPRVCEVGNYNQAKVSELVIDDEVDEPAFVDIPTLVAVLIKPDDNIAVNSHQIEEICSDGHAEEGIDAEFQVASDRDVSRGTNVFEDFQIDGVSIDNNSSVEVFDPIQFSPKLEASAPPSPHPRDKAKLRKQDSIDGDLTSKRSTNLQSLKKYGSIESLPRKREIACTIQRSNTNLEKRNGSLDKIKKLNNIKEVEDHKLNKLGNSLRNLGGWPSKDLQRKGSNDSDKSSKDSSGAPRPKSQQRKQSVDCLKRKTSKDSSSSSSKDELLAGPPPDRASRKGSLDQEQHPTRTHTPIQRARRADIVAAVTERLYSSKKVTEDVCTLAGGTTVSTPASELRSPESSDVKLASATRMRLQEISRKMLAKRRRICVDTQTEIRQTVRVRDVASLTDEPKIVSKDASVLTDRHEDYEILSPSECPVVRVKEMSTLTDANPRQPVTRCKDAGNVTDDYYEDYASINSPRNDSGIMSDDTQNYAESNFSSTEISDLLPIVGRRSAEFVENSTNTRKPSGLPNSGSQTIREDPVEASCACYRNRCCGGTRQLHGNDEPNRNQSYHRVEKNVISISLPDMVNITIESSNGLESKIKVFEGNEQTDERSAVNFKDTDAQTDAKDAQEIGTSTDDAFGQVSFNDLSASIKPIIAQTDGKTFRIENIFHEPRGATRITPTIEIVSDTCDDVVAKNSLTVTNSIGTSIAPETRENATGTELGRNYGSRMYLGATPRRRSAANDVYAKNTWPTRWRSCSPNSRRRACYPGFAPIAEDHRTSSSMSDCEDDYRSADSHQTGQIGDKPNSRRDESGRGKTEKYFLKIAQTDLPVLESKAKSAITMKDVKNGLEQDMNFSDDSLDPTDEGGKSGRKIDQSSFASSHDTANAAGTREADKVCPPDVVAHTKKDITKVESLIPSDNSCETTDFEDSSQIEFPKTSVDGPPSSSFATPLDDMKLLILGDPCYAANNTDDSDFADFGDQPPASILRVDEGGCCSGNELSNFANGEHSAAPKSIIKKAISRFKGLQVSADGQSSCGSKDPRRGNSKRRVRFAIPEVFEITSSESEINENLTSEDEVSDDGPRTILEEYLDEAVVFMRNMNSMNEYMSAACGFDKRTINGRYRRRGKGKSSNYIEYEGRRISLEDDTDQYLKSDDEDLSFNVKSYEKCMRSMDRLEECLVKVKRHDEILRDNYGIGKGGSTGARLDLAKFSIDSNHSGERHNCKDKFDEPKTSSNFNDTETIEDTVDAENSNLSLRKESDKDYASDVNEISENIKKIRSRRFSRFSDMRRKYPTTYSQLRGRYASQAPESRITKDESTLGFGENRQCSEISGSTSTADADRLQTPDCYLVLPKTKRSFGDPSEGIKSSNSRPRFSLSMYDSSNESSSSNEALATFMESIDNVDRSRDKFKYPGSPRAKFLQLLSERRRIVENTRSTGAS